MVERRPANVIMHELRADLASLPGVRAFPVMRQASAAATESLVQFVLGGPTYEDLASWRDTIIESQLREPGGSSASMATTKKPAPNSISRLTTIEPQSSASPRPRSGAHRRP